MDINYETAYKEALERAQNVSREWSSPEAVAKYVFPEIKNTDTDKHINQIHTKQHIIDKIFERQSFAVVINETTGNSFRARSVKCNKGNKLAYGTYGLIATEPGWIKANQIEAARVACTRFIKRGGQVWIDIFPQKPVTKKPADSRMGSGKGSVEFWVAVVKPGRVLFEMAGVSEDVAKEALRLAGHKLPVKTKFIKREEVAQEIKEEGGEG